MIDRPKISAASVKLLAFLDAFKREFSLTHSEALQTVAAAMACLPPEDRSAFEIAFGQIKAEMNFILADAPLGNAQLN